MNEDIPLPFDLPAVARQKVSAAFDGGRITSDSGVMLLAQAERRLGIADQRVEVETGKGQMPSIVGCSPQPPSPVPRNARSRSPSSTDCPATSPSSPA